MSESNRIRQVFLCWFICIGSLAAYLWANGDLVMAGALGVVGVAGVAGYCVGGTVTFASSLAMAITVMLAGPVERAFGPAVAECLGTGGVLNRVLTIIVAAVALSLVAMLIAEVIWNRLMENRLKLFLFNRTFGLFLGAIQGSVVCVGVLGGSLVAEPYARATSLAKVHTVQDYVRHCTADGITRISAGTRRSQVYPLLELANPFDRLPSLRKLSSLSQESRRSRSTSRSTINAPRRPYNRSR